MFHEISTRVNDVDDGVDLVDLSSGTTHSADPLLELLYSQVLRTLPLSDVVLMFGMRRIAPLRCFRPLRHHRPAS